MAYTGCAQSALAAAPRAHHHIWAPPCFPRLQALPAKFGPQEFRSDFAPLAQLHQLASDLRNVNLLLTDSEGDLGRNPAALVEHIRQVRTGAWIACRAE